MQVHTLGDERGACLELVVSRMKTMAEHSKRNKSSGPAAPIETLRSIAVSATIPNLTDLGHWLDCKPDTVLKYGDEYRPVPLEKTVMGFDPYIDKKSGANNSYMFVKWKLNTRLLDIIHSHSGNRPTLVFCYDRKSCADAARDIVTSMDGGGGTLVTSTSSARSLSNNGLHENAELRSLVAKGVGYHHAGISREGRAELEKLFIDGHLRVLCATSTLAVGVNLPAHLVIIRGSLSPYPSHCHH